MVLAFGDIGETGRVSVMIQQQTQFYRSLGTAEICPWEEVQTQENRGTVQREKAASEAESVFRRGSLVAGLKDPMKQVLLYLPEAIGVRISRGIYWVLL